MITFDSVSKQFGDHVVLDNLTFSIDTNEKISLIGPSGSGKTTILRTLMTLEQPTSGRVFIDDQLLWDGDRDRSVGRRALASRGRQMRDHIGMVFQQFELFPNMTATENVAAPLRFVRKRTRDEAKAAARDLLALVGLESKETNYPHQLSGGQQQRVAIARAMSLQPRILLLDEVTSALDPELVGEVLGVLRNLAETTAMTMLFVTHEMKFASEISDRILMFDAGTIIEDRSPTAMMSDPSQERTKQFLRSVLEPQ